MQDELRRDISNALGDGTDVTSLSSVSGGSINRAAVADTNRGKVFVKWNDGAAPTDMFEREAEALRTMREATSVLTIPEPICWRAPDDDRPGFLVLEYLEPGDRVADFDDQLARGLAEMHDASADGFGFPHDNYCGTTPQPNPWRDDWVAFYRDARLGHQVELADRGRGLSSDVRGTFDRLLDTLDTALVGGAPALIHGDLWRGNLHVAPDGTPSILDPAAYYGHREAELGMMKLFGGFSDRVFDRYAELTGLASGWRKRLDLYALYHVLNHYNLFGGHWLQKATNIAEQYLN